ncbi:acid phosphatase/vanadium-dependenthaloperoxidase-related protein [Striga asiatica]|uniref:Acid phosphatase/vanadium-dependenthaloperoxidase-related protein n=1 Tax=Striga asiatica TaxID=4170 RepID=A0A5A7Q0K8_STRAF|nr:acid phosphatase/vanadium-dependenthaloperoxidase-related protein [Striga asiatica]
MAPSSCRRKGSRKSSSSRRKILNKNSSKNRKNSIIILTGNESSKTEGSEGVADNNNNNNASICSTPKAERFRLTEMGTCPPAPKKTIRVRLKNCSLKRTVHMPFFVSPDIDLFFYFALRGF